MEIQHQAKRAEHAVAIPNLIQLQLDSFRWFLEDGLHELFQSFSPIYDFTGQTAIELIDFTLGEPKYSLEECRSRDVTFESPIKARVRLRSSSGEVIENEVYLGDLPLMTEKGTFIINGAERVVVSQLSRSPGIYFRDQLDLTLNWQFFATLIPSEGPWVEIETDTSDAVSVRIGQNKKFAITTLLRALHDPRLEGDLVKDRLLDEDELSGRFTVTLRELPGKLLAAPVADPVTGEVLVDAGTVVGEDDFRAVVRAFGEENLREHTARIQVSQQRFETDEEILDRFGKRVVLEAPAEEDLVGKYAVSDLYDGDRLMVPAYGRIDRESAVRLVQAGRTNLEVLDVHRYIAATLELEDPKVVDCRSALQDIYHKIRPGDPVTDESARALLKSMFFDVRRYDLARVGRHKLNKKLGISLPHKVRWITRHDIVAMLEYLMGMHEAARPDATDEQKLEFTADDIDHLENKRVRSVGELLYSQLRQGFLRMEKVAKERMTSQDADNMVPQVVLSVKPVSAAIKSFFGSSQLSQFMDQTNPLAELTSKRRLSALGPGGLSRQSAKLEVRDVHHSHYGRICPIETPEGPNAGLIGSLATHARVNEYGFIETPFWKVENGIVDKSGAPIYLSADLEDECRVAPGDVATDSTGRITADQVPVRYRQD
ncbi:MAG: DNA-directed RNA polymerase subunit beta, partial [Armatimonadota bacterium]